MSFGVVVQDLKSPATHTGVLSIVGALLIAPVVETYLLGLFLRSLRGSLSDMRLSILSALGWGALHALIAPFWFFGVAWSFFVFSWFYLLWLPRSQAKAFSAAAVPHFLLNASALVLGGTDGAA
jgi:hypothetical protein